jgi:hypothetical protein
MNKTPTYNLFPRLCLRINSIMETSRWKIDMKTHLKKEEEKKMKIVKRIQHEK